MFTLDHFLSSDSNLTIEEQLNKYGEEGWQLVGILEKPYTTLGIQPRLDSNSIVFKKQMADEITTF